MTPFVLGCPYTKQNHDPWLLVVARNMPDQGSRRSTHTNGTGAWLILALHADCEQRAAAQRDRWARAEEHVVALKFRGGGATAQRKSNTNLRISRARPGGRPVRLESRGPGLADGG